MLLAPSANLVLAVTYVLYERRDAPIFSPVLSVAIPSIFCTPYLWSGENSSPHGILASESVEYPSLAVSLYSARTRPCVAAHWQNW